MKTATDIFDPNYVQEETDGEEINYTSESCDFEERFSPEMRKAYAEERKLEYDRNRSFFGPKGKGRRLVMYEGGVFANMVGDGGSAAKTMYRTIDDVMSRTRERHRQKLLAAIKKIQKECPKALYTFLLILKNGSNRKESIWAIAQRIKKYGAKRGVSTMGIWKHLEAYFSL